ncbi:hypothetical protein HYW42_02250 [Candidatus Daviesbacteria bacterium]|nr:hypothetical protein [Candidatus Daviesbacteria bacterium]
MTLTQTAILTKNLILISAITLFVGIVSFSGYKIWYNFYYLPSLPPVEEKPDTKFGILPYPKLPTSDISSSNFSYSLDTTTGGFPKFEKIMKVYFIPQPYTSFLSGDKTKSLAKKFGINSEPKIQSETEYLFSQDNQSLTVNLDSGNFTYKNEATKSSEQKITESDQQLVLNFKSFLLALDLPDSSLQNGRSKVNFLKIEGEDFTISDSQSDAQAAQVSLWPEDIDKIPVISEQTSVSLVNAVIKDNGKNLQDYFELDYKFWPIDKTTFATYPVKTGQQAFEDLQSGKGIIISKPKKAKVSITSVSLAYYSSKEFSSYLQPIFMFEGPEFVALVPAITEQFLDQTR